MMILNLKYLPFNEPVYNLQGTGGDRRVLVSLSFYPVVKGCNDAEIDVHGLEIAHAAAGDIQPQSADGRLLGEVHRGQAQNSCRRLNGQTPIDFPAETAIGALGLYVSNGSVGDFQPMNINFGIIPPLDHRVKGKRNKNAELSRRALEILEPIKQEVLWT